MLPQFHITVADPQNKEEYKLVLMENSVERTAKTINQFRLKFSIINFLEIRRFLL